MKVINFLPLITLITCVLTFSSCLKDTCEQEVTYIQVTPIYKTFEEIRSGQVLNEAPREMCDPGKIYFYNNYIFINEARDGIHVIDNTNPNNPQNIGFISIPGNEDIGVQNNLLYANSYVDLMTINITDLQNVQVVSRTEDVFPPFWEDVANELVLVYYEHEEVTETLDCETFSALQRTPGGTWWRSCPSCNSAEFFSPTVSIDESIDLNVQGDGGGSGGSGTGIAGSMARFSIISNHLYVVDDFNLNIFDLGNGTNPIEVNEVQLGWGIETIIPYQDKLFIGSNTGMFIFDNSDPAAPTELSVFQHARACDPVFVKDNYAYVTLRDGNQCDGFINQLDLIDVTELTDPKLIKSFPMDNPHGLSIKENTLFLCEGSHGLKSFDISEPTELDDHLLDQKKEAHAFDVIALPGENNTLLMIGEGGFYQYNFDNPSDMQLISQLSNVDCE